MGVVSVWHPLPGVYAGRDVEGVNVLSKDEPLPSIAPTAAKMSPKALVVGCKGVLEDLKRRITLHYVSGDPSGVWLEKCIPREDDVQRHVLSHRYRCPMVDVFRSDYRSENTWVVRPPTTSTSILPLYIALPTVRNQWDQVGPAAPFAIVEQLQQQLTRSLLDSQLTS